MGDLATIIGELASLIGSLTVVGGALMWIYNTFIAKPREKKRQADEEKRQNKMLKLISENNQPLSESIDRLSGLLDESQRDRETLHGFANKNKGRLNNHEERIIVLEDRSGVKRTYYEKKEEE